MDAATHFEHVILIRCNIGQRLVERSGNE
jgi:hypothetical protein